VQALLSITRRQRSAGDNEMSNPNVEKTGADPSGSSLHPHLAFGGKSWNPVRLRRRGLGDSQPAGIPAQTTVASQNDALSLSSANIPMDTPSVILENVTPAHWESLKEFLVDFARDHSGVEDQMTSALALHDKARVVGCTQLDVIDALKSLHEEGAVCLEKWDWFVHGFQPWQEWQGDTFFERFRLRGNQA
jgi:hypothetical protein